MGKFGKWSIQYIKKEQIRPRAIKLNRIEEDETISITVASFKILLSYVESFHVSFTS